MGFKARPANAVKKFMFLTLGFEKPTPAQMGEWGAWFQSIADRTLEQGGFWGGGREFTKKGSKELPFGKDAMTGYLIFTAKDRAEAEEIAARCPVVASNRVYEIMTK